MSSGPGSPALPPRSISPAEGCPVVLYEAGPHAGGRCRSFFDAELGVPHRQRQPPAARPATRRRSPISSGSARSTRFERPARRRSRSSTSRPASAGRCGRRAARCRGGSSAPPRRVPGTRARDYLAALRLRRAAPGDTVADGARRRDTVLFRRLWEPLAVAALNTAAEEASARLLWRILAETLGRGAAACRPLLAREGLSESLVDPALALLAGRGAEIRFGARLRALGVRRAIASPSWRSTPARWRCRPGDSVDPRGAGRDCRAAGSRARRAGRLCADRQRAFPLRRAGGAPAVRRPGRRHRRMGVPQARGRVGDGQRRRPHRRPPGRGAARGAVARCRARARSAAAAGAAGPHRQGAAGDISRHPGAAGAAPGRRDTVEQSSPCRRLCRYWLACYD